MKSMGLFAWEEFFDYVGVMPGCGIAVPSVYQDHDVDGQVLYVSEYALEFVCVEGVNVESADFDVCVGELGYVGNL